MAFAKALHSLPEGAVELVEHLVNHVLLAVMEHGPLLFAAIH